VGVDAGLGGRGDGEGAEEKDAVGSMRHIFS